MSKPTLSLFDSLTLTKHSPTRIEDKENIVVGLKNITLSTCWVNASIQLLIHIPQLRNLILTSEPITPIQQELKDLITQMKETQMACSAKSIMDLCKYSTEQNDSLESFTKLISELCQNWNTAAPEYIANPFKDFFSFTRIEFGTPFADFIHTLKQRNISLYKKYELLSLPEIEEFAECLNPIRLCEIIIKANHFKDEEERAKFEYFLSHPEEALIPIQSEILHIYCAKAYEGNFLKTLQLYLVKSFPPWLIIDIGEIVQPPNIQDRRGFERYSDCYRLNLPITRSFTIFRKINDTTYEDAIYNAYGMILYSPGHYFTITKLTSHTEIEDGSPSSNDFYEFNDEKVDKHKGQINGARIIVFERTKLSIRT
jgi:hypothetical protein